MTLSTLNIWVDADACPVAIREILCRAAKRTKTLTTFIANQYIKLPPSPYVQRLQVAMGFDVADNVILQKVIEGDIVITQDIPLAAEAIEKKAQVLTPRGKRYTLENIKADLKMRDFMETMRASGLQSGGPPPMNHNHRQAFANALDRLLTTLK